MTNSLIFQIVERADDLGMIHPRLYSRLTCMMDLSAVHEATPLRLEELLGADDFNFLHDISGIARHLNRSTGKMVDGFRPRFSAPRAA